MANSHNRDGENPAEYIGSIKRHPVLSLIILLLIIVSILLGVFLNHKSRRISGLEERIGVLESEVQKRIGKYSALKRYWLPLERLPLGGIRGRNERRSQNSPHGFGK